ncbi:MAG: Eco57I restriction-modification methylase domain-containing protein [Lentisphaerae bacterium]|nr:Eco57I restriction-modification methylase domain-containing protein [Lentisphaerota bacterium]
MAQADRQSAVLSILQNLRDLDGLKKLFWEELNYERENKPLSPRQWPENAKQSLAEDPILFAGGGEDGAFHIVYCRLASPDLSRGFERPVVNQLLRDHPYALFVFSNRNQSAWHFLNVKFDEQAERRRLFRRITVRPGAGLRTATERVQLLDLAEINPELFGIKPLAIQQRCDAAFDVEAVTKDFFREIANWYFWALKHVRFPKGAPKEADDHDHISVIRLITRLIFCWFVKEKGLIPDTLFDARKLAQTLIGFEPEKTSDKESVFYRAILQNLFFATLNTEMDKRGWTKEEQNFMAHSLYRHRECFSEPKSALDLFKEIPFLNGGLFECLDKDLGENAKPRYVRIDGFSRREDSQPIVPDFLFFGPECEVDLSADYGDKKFRRVPVRGLIHIFNRYHFTIEENTPIEQEVALDPELSGKVFENLLAAYNPETGATARKQTGSFYTPREIVNYMVDEALIACLKTKLEAVLPSVIDVEARLRHLFAYNDEPHQFTAPEVDALIAAIDGLKSLDPAVGSGAFPMGILHKLVFILGKLDPRNEKWKERQIVRVRDTMATAEKIEDATARERAVRELEQQITGINEAFEHNELDYGRKLYLIENCIYGVDIQPIAVQIAKMRFFISLIVDQKIDDTLPNRGVRPLPNLETKFVAANTLIGIERKERQGDFLTEDTEAHQKLKVLRERLTEVRHRHFTARTNATKTKCRQQDRDLRAEVSGLLDRAGQTAAVSRQLASWDPYDQNVSADFFDPEWMFGVRDGVDIVIGNPPYVRIQTLQAVEVAYLKEHYASAGKGNFDLYVVFVERGMELLHLRGQLAFILPHKFFNAQYGAPLRALLAKDHHLRHVVHFGDQQIFPGATNYVCLLFLAKAGADTCRFVRVENLEQWLATLQGTEGAIPASRVTGAEWNFAIGKGAALFEKFQRMPVKLGDVARVFQGLVTGADKVFTLNSLGKPKRGIAKVRDSEGKDWEIEVVALRRFLYDVSLWPYVEPEANRWLLFPYSFAAGQANLIPAKNFAADYPLAWAYLKAHSEALRKRESGKWDHDEWYAFGRSQNMTQMETPKLIVQVIAASARYAFDPNDVYFTGGGNGPYYGLRWASSDERRSLYYLQALLNSRLLDFYLHRISTTFQGGYFSYGKQFIDQLPIHPIDFAAAAERTEHDALVGLVERILAARRANPVADTAALEREIDERVYRLYGLTEEEIKIVEESGK